jgi:hypothetical protein
VSVPPHLLDASGLTPEELAELGQVERVVPYGIDRGEWLWQLLLLSPATLVGVLGWSLSRTTGFQGLVAWGPRGGLRWYEAALVAACSGALLLVCLGLLSHGALYMWRTLGRSPGLVIGSQGLRLHGAWPRAVFVPWHRVAGASWSLDRVRVRLTWRPYESATLRALVWVFAKPSVVITQEGAEAICAQLEAQAREAAPNAV